MKTSAAIIASTLSLSQAMLHFGKCPTPQVVNTMDRAAFAGNWYEIQRDNMFPMEITAECVTHEYKLTNESELDLRFRGWYAMMFFQYSGVGGQLLECGTSNDWTCQATMAGGDKRSAFNFLEVDTSSHNVLYVCEEMMDGAMYSDFVFIMSRDQKMDENKLAGIKDRVKAQLPDYDLSWFNMHSTIQGDTCQYEWTL